MLWNWQSFFVRLKVARCGYVAPGHLLLAVIRNSGEVVEQSPELSAKHFSLTSLAGHLRKLV